MVEARAMDLKSANANGNQLLPKLVKNKVKGMFLPYLLVSQIYQEGKRSKPRPLWVV